MSAIAKYSIARLSPLNVRACFPTQVSKNKQKKRSNEGFIDVRLKKMLQRACTCPHRKRKWLLTAPYRLFVAHTPCELFYSLRSRCTGVVLSTRQSVTSTA